jgi:hypothetical protein
VPAASPEKLYAPELLAVVVLETGPLKVMVVPSPLLAGATLPEMLKLAGELIGLSDDVFPVRLTVPEQPAATSAKAPITLHLSNPQTRIPVFLRCSDALICPPESTRIRA